MQEHAETGGGPGSGTAFSEQKRVPGRLIIFAIVAICAIIFVAQNRDKVTIHFLFIDVSARVWIGFVICLALGALLGAFLTRWWRRRQLRD